MTKDLNLKKFLPDVHSPLEIEGTISDITILRDSLFYVNIGKYDQFVGGWADARDNWYWEEIDVGDSTEIVIKTPMKDDYLEMFPNCD